MVSYKTYIDKTCKLKSIQISGWRLFGYTILTLVIVNIISNLIVYIILRANPDFISRAVAAASYTYGKLVIFFVGVIFFPLFEELAFSFFLGKKKSQVFISISLIFGLFITALNFVVFNQLEFSLSNFTFVWIGSSLFTSIWVILPVFTKISLAERVYRVIKNNERPLGYFTVFVFAAFHLYFSFLASHTISLIPSIYMFLFYVTFRLVVNQIRISKGFLLAVAFHSLYNIWAYWDILGHVDVETVFSNSINVVL